MKTIITAIAFTFISFATSAQVIVDGQDIIQEEGTTYVQISMEDMGAGFKPKLQMYVDYGQQAKLGEKVLKDSSGQKIYFQSMAGGLNYMAANGYHFVGQGHDGTRTFYILRRQPE